MPLRAVLLGRRRARLTIEHACSCVRGISQETCLQGAKILSVGEKYAGKITVFKETLYTFLLLCIGRDSSESPAFFVGKEESQKRIFAVFGKTQKRKEVLK